MLAGFGLIIFGVVAVLAGVFFVPGTPRSWIMQSRLMARRGLLIGSLLTAIPFFVIHIPLAFAAHGPKGTTWAGHRSILA
jgi:uncharacterized protein